MWCILWDALPLHNLKQFIDINIFYILYFIFVAFEVIPFLVMVIGLDNITTITNAVVSAPPTVAVRFRIAHVRSTCDSDNTF